MASEPRKNGYRPQLDALDERVVPATVLAFNPGALAATGAAEARTALINAFNQFGGGMQGFQAQPAAIQAQAAQDGAGLGGTFPVTAFAARNLAFARGSVLGSGEPRGVAVRPASATLDPVINTFIGADDNRAVIFGTPRLAAAATGVPSLATPASALNTTLATVPDQTVVFGAQASPAIRFGFGSSFPAATDAFLNTNRGALQSNPVPLPLSTGNEPLFPGAALATGTTPLFPGPVLGTGNFPFPNSGRGGGTVVGGIGGDPPGTGNFPLRGSGTGGGVSIIGTGGIVSTF